MDTLNWIRIPVALPASAVWLRCSPLPREGGAFAPATWPRFPLAADPDPAAPGWYQVDLATLGLADGQYEYELGVDQPDAPPLVVPDPFAEEITKLGGYRGVFTIRGGQRVRPRFDWPDELPPGVTLPGNHETVIYELPMRWVDPGDDGIDRQVGLGTFDKAIFELMQDGEHIRTLGVNAIELLPIQDSPDTLNWGYGSRFFFAPDNDLGEVYDLKLFILACHRAGIRVILDVVMNHSKKCALQDLALPWFYIDPNTEERISPTEPRPTWGGAAFRYQQPVNGGYLAREFQYRMAAYWVREYHVDGFRLDEFRGINNWDFVREFRYRALTAHRALFPDRPFIVIAEDTDRRASATAGDYYPATDPPPPDAPPTLRVTDAIWDFTFQEELRRLTADMLETRYGEPGRHAHVVDLLTGGGYGFGDLAQRVTYCTSHDVEPLLGHRMFSYFLDQLQQGWAVAAQAHGLDPLQPPDLEALAREQIVTAFALMLTCRGIPMFLAGEEFGDLHDTDPSNWHVKMSDPIDWYRSTQPGFADVLARVRELIALRADRTVGELHRNELAFFGLAGIAPGFQADFDDDGGGRVFAYCRPGAGPAGGLDQVAVVANCGWQAYPQFRLAWPWPVDARVREYGGSGQPTPLIGPGTADLALGRFQTRVFRITAA